MRWIASPSPFLVPLCIGHISFQFASVVTRLNQFKLADWKKNIIWKDRIQYDDPESFTLLFVGALESGAGKSSLICERFEIPLFIIRSKSDIHIKNIMQDLGYYDENDGDNSDDYFDDYHWAR